MSGLTFKSIFEGKQDIFDEKVIVDSGLLSKLETCGIITNNRRITIEVTYVIVLQFFNRTIKQILRFRMTDAEITT